MATDRHQAPSYPLRMPDDLKSRVQEAASVSGRSLHAELLARLEHSFSEDNADELQLRISRLEGELAGAKFATDSMMEDASRQLAKMSRDRAHVRMQADRLCNVLYDMTSLTQEFIDGEVRDPQLAVARFEFLQSQIEQIEDALGPVDPDDEEADEDEGPKPKPKP